MTTTTAPTTPTPVKTEDRLRVRLELEAIPRGWTTGCPANRRLAQLLKACLRSFGFRCLRVEDVTQPPAQVAPMKGVEDFPP